MNSSLPYFHAIKGSCLNGHKYKSKWCKKVKSCYISPAQLSLPFLLTLHQLCLPPLCLPLSLAFRCDVSVVFSQTQAVTLWTAAAFTLMVFHCCIPQVILNLQLVLFKSFSCNVCFKECVNSSRCPWLLSVVFKKAFNEEWGESSMWRWPILLA